MWWKEPILFAWAIHVVSTANATSYSATARSKSIKMETFEEIHSFCDFWAHWAGLRRNCVSWLKNKGSYAKTAQTMCNSHSLLILNQFFHFLSSFKSFSIRLLISFILRQFQIDERFGAINFVQFLFVVVSFQTIIIVKCPTIVYQWVTVMANPARPISAKKLKNKIRKIHIYENKLKRNSLRPFLHENIYTHL